MNGSSQPPMAKAAEVVGKAEEAGTKETEAMSPTLLAVFSGNGENKPELYSAAKCKLLHRHYSDAHEHCTFLYPSLFGKLEKMFFEQLLFSFM
ncbi:hypothetical protein scyTo_0017808 [Scyliorhinus torazame]|uniref:Uncharacterized protein n=1 Tax=Scyliorhinus torazame TaxID=75743 RepID=A0A401Q0Q6_SCYTO|nr:hypothetical protein [Scyliorhinus torazame]